MISLGQLFISLFTTGGKPNPIALLIFAGTMFLGCQYWQLKSENRELMRQSKVVMKSSNDKVEQLNEARNEQEKSNSYAGTDAWHDWADRLQNGSD